MGFILDLFRKKKNKKFQTKNKAVQHNEHVMGLMRLRGYMDGILRSDRYVARSEYIDKILHHKDKIDFFVVRKSGDMLESFCKKNHAEMVILL